MPESGNATDVSTSAVRRWWAPVVWASLILSLSLLPDSYFYFGAPQTREARRVHYYFEVATHLCQFCVFFLLMNRSARTQTRSRPVAIILSFLAVLGLSLMNESLQAFTPTRTFDLLDMAMDALGGLVGASAVVVANIS